MTRVAHEHPYDRARDGGRAPDATHKEPSHAADVIYTCPMHPQIRQVGPGNCPGLHVPRGKLFPTLEIARAIVEGFKGANEAEEN